MQDLGVLQRLQNRFLESVQVEGVFVWGLVAANSRLETFLFAEQVVHQAQVTAWDGDPPGGIDGRVKRELDPFDQVEGNGIFKTTICVCYVSRLFLLSLSLSLSKSGVELTATRDKIYSVHQLESNIGQIQGLGGIRKTNC